MSADVQYLGFVYIRSEDGRRMPGLSAVRKASKLLEKPKKAQKLHPLFARGFDTDLKMTIGNDGIIVTIDDEETGEEKVLMDHPMHKVSFVVSVKKTVYIVAKHDLRGKGVMFKCHGFRTKKKALAASIAKDIAAICNNVFKQLRQTQVYVRSQNRRQAFRGKDSVKSKKSEDGEVQMRTRTTEDPDVRALRTIIAQTRISVIEGKGFDEIAAHGLSDEQTAAADLMLTEQNPEDETFVEVLRQLQTGINAVNLSDMDVVTKMIDENLEVLSDYEKQGDEESEGESFDVDELDLIDFEDFTDDFARMTLMLHDGYHRGPRLPSYAEITLDSEMFEVSWV